MRRAILHEGKNDKAFLENLLKYLELDFNDNLFHCAKGKSNIFNSDSAPYQRLAQLKDAEQLEKILFIIDAEDTKSDQLYGGYENTEQEIKSVIENLGFAEISDYYIVCDPITKTGYLESLILATLDNTQQQCINTFLSCSKFSGKENHKAIIHQIYNIAYPNHPYNFDHQHFSNLKSKIQWLMNDA